LLLLLLLADICCKMLWHRMGVFGSNASGTQTAQLTIFYAGTVNVFNDVTQEKVRKILCRQYVCDVI
jgi:hypothetical protein